MTENTQDNRPRTANLLRVDSRSFPAFADIFGNDHGVEIEIGCGKGKFLLARAIEQPDINFIGVDIVWKWMKYGVERSEKHGLGNIKFHKGDVRELIRHGIPDVSVSIFHIYFPDPWPKRRHRKRRLVTFDFLRLLHPKLSEAGYIEIATDYEDYFIHMRAAVAHSGIAWREVTETSNERLFGAGSKTNYEIKYEAAGRDLFYLELRK
jgi:tRNA (guanine-N7-)-methyltransferase